MNEETYSQGSSQPEPTQAQNLMNEIERILGVLEKKLALVTVSKTPQPEDSEALAKPEVSALVQQLGGIRERLQSLADRVKF